jgi:cytidylate kinase
LEVAGVALVCISRDVGAGGETVGRLVAERLGLRYVDEEVITRAAERGGVDEDQLADAEQRKSRIRRVIEMLADTGAVTSTPGVEPSSVRAAREESHRGLIRDVVEEIAGEGNAVIVAHAASLALAGRDGTLRVFVTASPEVRTERLAESEDAATAAKLVKESDAARAEYFKRFYSVDRELPTHYDLVVNTDVLAPEQAAEIIAHAARLGRPAKARRRPESR